MNSATPKAICALLAALLILAAAAPACFGSEDCSMPCCRRGAASGSHAHAAGGAAAQPCCPATAVPADGMGAGCRFVQHHLALPSGSGAGPAVTAEAFSAVCEHRFPQTDVTPMPRQTDPSPPDAPLYMRLQVFLI